MNYSVYSLSLGQFGEQQEVCDVKHFLFLVEQHLRDAFIQSCFNVFEKSSKCILYKEIVDKFCLQKYLKKRLAHVEKSVLCKYRICAHSLKVEKGSTKLYQELNVNVYSVTWEKWKMNFILFWFVLHFWIFVKDTLSFPIIENLTS